MPIKDYNFGNEGRYKGRILGRVYVKYRGYIITQKQISKNLNIPTNAHFYTILY